MTTLPAVVTHHRWMQVARVCVLALWDLPTSANPPSSSKHRCGFKVDVRRWHVIVPLSGCLDTSCSRVCLCMWLITSAVAGAKRVSVSRTAGHTKRAQTIPLTPHVHLLDCPGIVFPAALVPDPPAAGLDSGGTAAAGGGSGGGECGDGSGITARVDGDHIASADRERAIQECCGVLPLAQVREPYSGVRFLAEHLPLEHMYGLRLPEVCSVHAVRCVVVLVAAHLSRWRTHALWHGRHCTPV